MLLYFIFINPFIEDIIEIAYIEYLLMDEDMFEILYVCLKFLKIAILTDPSLHTEMMLFYYTNFKHLFDVILQTDGNLIGADRKSWEEFKQLVNFVRANIDIDI